MNLLLSNIGMPHPAMRRPGSLLLVAAAIYMVSAVADYHTAEKRAAEEAIRNDMRNRYFRAAREKQLARHYREPFDQLRAVGLIDGNSPHHWIPLVKQHAGELGLPSVDMELGIGKPFPDGWGSVPIIAVPMSLRVGLVHEGQLLQFLERLRALPSALFLVRDCDLYRPPGRKRFASATANLRARCELLWLTVLTDPVNAQENTP